MAEPFEYSRRRRDGGSLDELLRPQGAKVLAAYGQHKLDSEEARRELRQMLEWYYYEQERQSLNRLDMAMGPDSHINRVTLLRSRAFADAIKAGGRGLDALWCGTSHWHLGEARTSRLARRSQAFLKARAVRLHPPRPPLPSAATPPRPRGL